MSVDGFPHAGRDLQSRPKRFNTTVSLGSIRETLRTEQHAPSGFGDKWFNGKTDETHSDHNAQVEAEIARQEAAVKRHCGEGCFE
ncbi:MAG: hypothetical protein Q8L68_02980 [Methylococcales bacterium]|nr:hypothetical protein [Methylococcales bacterium]